MNSSTTISKNLHVNLLALLSWSKRNAERKKDCRSTTRFYSISKNLHVSLLPRWRSSRHNAKKKIITPGYHELLLRYNDKGLWSDEVRHRCTMGQVVFIFLFRLHMEKIWKCVGFKTQLERNWVALTGTYETWQEWRMLCGYYGHRWWGFYR